MPLAVRRPAAALASVLLLAGFASAAMAQVQGAPPLRSMPPPPSASDPAPRETSAEPAKRQPRKARTPKVEPDVALPQPYSQPTRNRGATSGSYERPQKYVPEEFDRSGGGSGGSRMEPTMSSSGRPGMGMRF